MQKNKNDKIIIKVEMQQNINKNVPVLQSQNLNENQELSLQQIDKLLDNIKVTSISTTNNQQKYISPDQVQGLQKKQIDGCADQLTLDDVTINRDSIIFGDTGLIPGAIDEVDFSLSLNFKQGFQKLEKNNGQEQNSYVLRIIAICKNEEFQSLDEYVFSVRSANCYEYYEEIRFKIKRGERADIKVAVKIPLLKQNYAIHGYLQIRLQDLEPIQIPILAKCLIPEIISLRSLYKEDEGVNLIKIPAKKGMQRTPPIPFKNLSPFQLSIQIEAISNQNFQDKPYDIIPQNQIICLPNSQFFISMLLRQNMNYVGILPKKYVIRKILLLKIKKCLMMFHFPLQVTIFEGQSLEGN